MIDGRVNRTAQSSFDSKGRVTLKEMVTMSKKGKGQSNATSRRSNKAPTRLEDQVYYLVQFVDDGILDIKTDNDLRTREDGLKEAQYGDAHYLCTIIFESDDKEEVIKRKVAMQKLKNPKPTKQSKTKKAGKKTKNNEKNDKENKEDKENGEATKKKMVDKEEIARKKAEREKKRAEQQKAKENKEREKAVKEKERAALMERDNRVLAEMNSLAGNLNRGKTLDGQSKQPWNDVSDEEESDADTEEPLVDEYFGGIDVVSECSAYLHTPPNSTMVTPKSTPLAKNQHDLFGSKNQSPITPLLPPTRPQLESPSQNASLQTPRSTVGGKRPRHWTTTLTQRQQESATRPTMGQKKPRSMFHNISGDGETAAFCQKCEEFQRIMASQEEEIAQLKAQVNGHYEDLPRPGKVPQIIAARFKMVELSKGRGVYLYEDNINTARSKNSPTSAACFLLSCFYKNSELVGKNLTGANAKEGLNTDIVLSILDFAVKEGGKVSAIKQALRNKISSLTTRASGWQPARKVIT